MAFFAYFASGHPQPRMLVSLPQAGSNYPACFPFSTTLGFSAHASRMQAPNSGRRCSQLLGPEVEFLERTDSRSALRDSNHIGQETRPMKSIVSRSVIIASVFLTGLIVFSATPSIADSPLSKLQPQTHKQNPAEVIGKVETAGVSTTDAASATRSRTVDESKTLIAASPYVATAYSLKGRTASGRMVSRGLIAADPSVLPLGSRVRLEHPGYSGEYLVADTGGAIRGRRIDIWTPTSSEAMRFGRRTVKLTVLSYGVRKPRRTARS